MSTPAPTTSAIQHDTMQGMISHFALYGAGVTSYFKFLKYCCWSFFVVSCAVLVHLFVNVNGGSITAVSNTNRISWTTIGNLGNSINVTEVTIPVLASCMPSRSSTKTPDPPRKTRRFFPGPKNLDSWFYPSLLPMSQTHQTYNDLCCCFIQTTQTILLYKVTSLVSRFLLGSPETECTSKTLQVVLPFCDAEQYSTCIVDKENLGMYYGYIDAGIVILLLAGYFWVNGFITDEFITIKRNTVTAAGAC